MAGYTVTQPQASAMLHPLMFMAGTWSGKDQFGNTFYMHFTRPMDEMFFGSMQASENGKTPYWETMRFYVDGARVALHPIASGRDCGVYHVINIGADGVITFYNPDNPRERRLTFGPTTEHGLVMTAEGKQDGNAYKFSWQVTRL